MLARRQRLSVLWLRDAIIGQHRGMKRNRLLVGFPLSQCVSQAAPRVFPKEISAWSCMNHRAVKLGAIKLALFAIGFFVFFDTRPHAHAQPKSHLYKQGQNAEAKEDIVTAYE